MAEPELRKERRVEARDLPAVAEPLPPPQRARASVDRQRVRRVLGPERYDEAPEEVEDDLAEPVERVDAAAHHGDPREVLDRERQRDRLPRDPGDVPADLCAAVRRQRLEAVRARPQPEGAARGRRRASGGGAFAAAAGRAHAQGAASSG